MKRYIIAGVGSPSDLESFGQKYDSLGGMNISDYLSSKGILHLPRPLVVSCHRTLKRVVSYALESELHAAADEDRKVVVVLFGGMSLALPGIFSAESVTLPIIGVPAAAGVHGGGLDAATAVYNIPPGTVVAGVPVHYKDNPSLDKAILIAEKILDLDSDDVSVVCSENSKDLSKIDLILNSEKGCSHNTSPGIFGVPHEHRKGCKDKAMISVHVASSSLGIGECDRVSHIALQCRVPSADKVDDQDSFIDTLKVLGRTKNTLYFGSSTNAALFLVRILALGDASLRAKLLEYKELQRTDTELKYGEKIAISDDLFMKNDVSHFLTEDEARKLAEDNLNNVLAVLDTSKLADGVKYEKGKVRENFVMTDKLGNKKRVLVTSDRVSVFDSVVGSIPFKGQVLDDLAHWWFGETGFLVQNHVLARPSPVITIAEQCTPLKVEMVVRAYLTGTSSTSIWTAYEKGSRVFCGNCLDDGMKKNQKLPYVMITPSTKADYGGHDLSVSADDILDMKVLPGNPLEQKSLMQQLSSHALVLFGKGALLADKIGLILVDTKYEFGIAKDGRVLLIDEIHTPDSSRFWEKDSYPESFSKGKDPKQLSKQFARDAVIAKGYDPNSSAKVPMLDDKDRVECAVRYILLCQRITGKPFVPDTRPVKERVYKHLEELGVLRR